MPGKTRNIRFSPELVEKVEKVCIMTALPGKRPITFSEFVRLATENNVANYLKEKE